MKKVASVPASLPSVVLSIQPQDLVEKRKLKARWTMEAEQDLRAWHPNPIVDLTDPDLKVYGTQTKRRKAKPVYRSLDDEWQS